MQPDYWTGRENLMQMSFFGSAGHGQLDGLTGVARHRAMPSVGSVLSMVYT